MSWLLWVVLVVDAVAISLIVYWGIDSMRILRRMEKRYGIIRQEGLIMKLPKRLRLGVRISADTIRIVRRIWRWVRGGRK